MLELSEKTKMLKGVYSNFNFMNAITAYLGNNVKVHTISGDVFEGIFRTFSPFFDIVIELAHDASLPLSSQISNGSVIDKMIFSLEHVSYFEIEDAENDSVARDEFLNDNEISRLSIKEILPVAIEKILEPWDCSGESTEYCELSESEGWNPKDMFEKNEHLGVTSNFNDELTLYTVPLQPQENPDSTTKPKKSKRNIASSSVTKTNHTTKSKHEGKSTKKSKASGKSQGVSSSSVSKDVNSKIKSCPNNKNTEKEYKSFENFKSSENSLSLKKKKLNLVDIKYSSTNVNSMITKAPGDSFMKSNLNPFAKEFIPACLRPSTTNLQVPISLSPQYGAPQTAFSSSYQLPVPHQSAPLFSRNSALFYTNHSERH